MNSEAVVACINECCKTWHDNNLSLLAAALLLRHFYVPSSDGPDNQQHDTTSENTLPIQDNSTTLTATIVTESGVNGVLNGTDLRNSTNNANINNLITPSSAANFVNIDKNNQNKTSTINALIHTSTTPNTTTQTTNTPTNTTSSPPTLDDNSKNHPSTPTANKITPNNYPTTPPTLSIPSAPSPCTTMQDTLNTPPPTNDTIHHPAELLSVTEHHAPPPPPPEFIPVNATVPTRHVKECGHNIICILQKNNFSLSTSKKVSAASQQVYVNHVYPPVDASKSVLEVIAVVKEFWKIQMAPSPLSFCGLVTYMKNLTTPAPDAVGALYPHVSMYNPLLCPPSPAVTPGPRRKRAKIDTTVQALPDTSILVQQLQTCTEHNKTLQNRISSFESDLKNIHQICLQQESELRNISQSCLGVKNNFQGSTVITENDLKVVPWPLGEKIVGVNHSLWQSSFTPIAPPTYWFREDQHILDVINNDKEGDVVCGYHVAQDIMLMKVDVEWLKKSFEHPTRKADETMQQLEQTYPRYDGYCADTGEVGLFSKGFNKIARRMTLHRKFA